VYHLNEHTVKFICLLGGADMKMTLPSGAASAYRLTERKPNLCIYVETLKVSMHKQRKEEGKKRVPYKVL
jgi:hypothetical protein